ncbi:MAG TPA: hypothetical protein DCP92_03350 [Nitrospiraceae bacterium]|jgi:hypothetical protein|nr:hypothetical protein [Nitrospiraceae bacterium]
MDKITNAARHGLAKIGDSILGSSRKKILPFSLLPRPDPMVKIKKATKFVFRGLVGFFMSYLTGKKLIESPLSRGGKVP